MAGRPTKRTPETEKKITDALRQGATRKDAAAIAGINYETFREWMNGFPAFSVSVEQAEAEIATLAAARILSEIRNPLGDWRAAESYLKRRRRDEWGDTVKTEVTGQDGSSVLLAFSEEVLRAYGDDVPDKPDKG